MMRQDFCQQLYTNMSCHVRSAGLQYGGPPPTSGFAGAPDGFAAHAGAPPSGSTGMDEEAARKIFENLFGTGFSSGGGGGPGCAAPSP
jgi:hypothetical protein